MLHIESYKHFEDDIELFEAELIQIKIYQEVDQHHQLFLLDAGIVFRYFVE